MTNYNLAKAHQIDGWMSPTELEWLAQNASKSSRILEVGSYKGRSARALADNTDGIVHCIDPWEHDYYHDDGELHNTIHPDVLPIFVENLIDHINSLKVLPLKMKFGEYFTTVKYDMIFLDGDHRYSAVKFDIIHAMKLLKQGGLLCGHDYEMPGWPSVKKAVDDTLGDTGHVETIWYKTI